MPVTEITEKMLERCTIDYEISISTDRTPECIRITECKPGHYIACIEMPDFNIGELEYMKKVCENAIRNNLNAGALHPLRVKLPIVYKRQERKITTREKNIPDFLCNQQ